MTDAPDLIDVEVGARIKLRRNQLGVSQSVLADALGITFQQVQKYERGTNRVSASKLVKTASILKTSVAALVGEGEAEVPLDGAYQMLCVPGAVEWLEAFMRVRDQDIRRTLLKLANALASPPETMSAPDAHGPRARHSILAP